MEQVVICATDDDFNQLVRGEQVVVYDRARQVVTDEATVRARFGVAPDQLPDVHALAERRHEALWCRDLARPRTGLPLRVSADDLEWRGAHRPALEELCATLGDDAVLERVTRWAGG